MLITRLCSVVVVIAISMLIVSSSKGIEARTLRYFFHLSDMHADPYYSSHFNDTYFCRNESFVSELAAQHFQNWLRDHNISDSREIRSRLHELTHIVRRNDIHSRVYREDAYPKSLNKGSFQYGRYGCDSPASLVESALDTMKAVNSAPEFIIVTGDLAAHHLETPWLREQGVNLSSILLKESYPNTPIFISIGNNDCFPDYFLRLGAHNLWLRQLWSLWSEFIPADQQISFESGGFYIAPVPKRKDLKILSLNTVWYSDEHAPHVLNASRTPDPAGQFSWLKQQLYDAQKNHYRVYIIGHIPPGKNWVPEYTLTYVSIIRQYPNAVAGHLFGHTHKDQFELLWDNDKLENAIAAILIQGSITPKKGNNPSFRYLSFDDKDADLQDYSEYYMDLIENSYYGKPTWRLEYTFSKLYNQTSLNPKKLAQVWRDLVNSPTLYSAFNANYESQAAADRYKMLCSIAHVESGPYDRCKSDFKNFSRR